MKPALAVPLSGWLAKRTLFGVCLLCVCISADAADPPAEPPVIDRVERGDGFFRFHLTGPPTFDYTVEFTQSLSTPKWTPLHTYRAKLNALDVEVTVLIADARAGFFRVRQEFCACRSE
jgi:hypothetical protein